MTITKGEALDMVCGEVKNYFSAHEDRIAGEYTIESGELTGVDFLQDGQWFRIVGSTFNDGVYKWGEESSLQDETFDGAVWAMKVPMAFLNLCDEIITFVQSDASTPSPFTSESFAGYSYTKAVNAYGVAVGWKEIFVDKLKRWRRLIV